MAQPDVLRMPVLHVETINGIRMDLGRMSLEQLVELEGQCRERALDAQVDYEIVRDTRERRQGQEAAS